MGLRQTLSDRPRLAAGLAGASLAIAAVAILVQSRGATPSADGGRAFFTVDDGKTWFADDAARLPPFDKDGKQAVRAHVFRCGGGAEFVNHLERFTPEAKRALESAGKAAPDGGKAPPNTAVLQGAFTSGREVKRPGDAKWVATAKYQDAARVTTAKCPDGTTEPTQVEP